MSRDATVAALSSGLVPSGVAVIRISGPLARSAIESVAGALPAPRVATLRALRDPRSGDVLDHALILFFPGPHSFTGEDVGELHCHGSRAVVDDVLRVLWSLEGVSAADAGDFTRQAFANGKMDLVQVEALGDLIHATTAGQRDLALSHLSGTVSRRLTGWRDRLADARAMIEAELDFSDEDDVPGSVLDSLPEQLRLLSAEIELDLQDTLSERLRDGFKVVLAGAPNSGKSTLMNALLQREAALVSSIAGTTRDRIDASLNLDGLPVLLSDTAGIRPLDTVDDSIEALGIDKTREALEQADCVVWLDGGDMLGVDQPPPRSIRVRSKSDLEQVSPALPGETDHLAVSGLTGDGLPTLKRLIRERLVQDHQSADGDIRIGNGTISVDQRRRAAMSDALTALKSALVGLAPNVPSLDLVAEDLRIAQSSLGTIIGDVDAEGVLDVVFSSFCIGK